MRRLLLLPISGWVVGILAAASDARYTGPNLEACPNCDRLLNNALYSVSIFTDGFESGSATAWSDEVP